MRLRDRIALLLRMDALIRRRATGKPEELATRLAVSRPTVHRYLNELKHFGAPIAYCRFRDSYYYTETYELDFSALH